MKSDLHSKLQSVARGYLIGKTYWICGEEVPMPHGICDAWGMSRSMNCQTMAIEVKVSRPDFRSPSQKGKERSSDFPMANQCLILCPAGLIHPEEVHPTWGLLWWDGEKIINKKRAPCLEMTAEQKLKVLVHFLNNGWNDKRPRFVETKTAPTLPLFTEPAK